MQLASSSPANKGSRGESNFIDGIATFVFTALKRLIILGTVCYGPGRISLSVLCGLPLFYLPGWLCSSSQQLRDPASSDVSQLDWATRQCAGNLNYGSVRRSGEDSFREQ